MRSFVIAVLGIALSGAAGCATVAPPDYRAILTAPCANAADTAPWQMVDAWDDGDSYRPEVQLRSDGVMVYAYDGGIYDNGRWSLEGATLRLDTNDHYADYEGVFDGQTVSGTMKNQPGNNGTWTMSRACDA